MRVGRVASRTRPGRSPLRHLERDAAGRITRHVREGARQVWRDAAPSAVTSDTETHRQNESKRAAVVSWLAQRYANPQVVGSNTGLDRLRIFMV